MMRRAEISVNKLTERNRKMTPIAILRSTERGKERPLTLGLGLGLGLGLRLGLGLGSVDVWCIQENNR